MRLGLNAINFMSGSMGGVETYFRNLVASLQEIDSINSYTLLCDKRNIHEFPIFNPNFKIRAVNFDKPSLAWFVREIARNAVGIDILKGLLDLSDIDVLHHPFTVLNPRGLKVSSVLTFWDMQQEFYPDFFSPLERRYRKANYRSSAEEATRMIASSEFTKKCLIEKYGIDPGKIDVIYTGHSSEYRVIDDDEKLKKFVRMFELTKPFVFYPAATWPHKNHKLLLTAIKILKDRRQFDGQLILTGIEKQTHHEVLREIEIKGLGRDVRMLGYVHSNELPFLYNLARMLVFPSLFEGFGIPLIEAMACGCPIVCSSAASLPEVLGRAGIMFNPYSAEDMAEKIRVVWYDAELRSQLRLKGLERAKAFNWRIVAEKTLDVYRNVKQ